MSKKNKKNKKKSPWWQKLICIVICIFVAIGTFLGVNAVFRKHIIQMSVHNTQEYYSVVFVDYNDWLILSNVITKDEPLRIATEPEREGYTFIAWNDGIKNYTTQELYNFKATKDTTFKAVYRANTLNVEFYNGIECISNTEYTAGSTLSLPEKPTREGYRFLGWNAGAVTERLSSNFETQKHNGGDKHLQNALSYANSLGAEIYSIEELINFKVTEDLVFKAVFVSEDYEKVEFEPKSSTGEYSTITYTENTTQNEANMNYSHQITNGHAIDFKITIEFTGTAKNGEVITETQTITASKAYMNGNKLVGIGSNYETKHFSNGDYLSINFQLYNYESTQKTDALFLNIDFHDDNITSYTLTIASVDAILVTGVL